MKKGERFANLFGNLFVKQGPLIIVVKLPILMILVIHVFQIRLSRFRVNDFGDDAIGRSKGDSFAQRNGR